MSKDTKSVASDKSASFYTVPGSGAKFSASGTSGPSGSTGTSSNSSLGGPTFIESSSIEFIGAGSIVKAIIASKVDPVHIHVSAPSTTNTLLKQMYPGLKVSKRNLDLFDKYECEIIFIAVSGAVIRTLFKLGGVRPAPLTINFFT